MRTAAPIVLVSHGSRDPRSAATMRRLAAGVAALWPAPVAAAFLDFNLPSVPWALRGFAADGPPIAVPALLTRAYHGRVDVPGVLASSGVAARLSPVLGPAPGEAPDPLLIAALRRRLSAVPVAFDGVVLAAAGTSDLLARETVAGVAAVLAAELDLPCVAAYASASPPSGAEAVAALRALGSARPAVASYFFATGRLHETVARSALDAGAVAVADPLGDAPELVELIMKRAATTSR